MEWNDTSRISITAASSDHHAIVNEVYSQVWKDFYAWKPPATAPLDALIQHAEIEDVERVRRHEGFGEKLKAIGEPRSSGEGSSRVPTPLHEGAASGDSERIFPVADKVTYWQRGQSPISSYPMAGYTFNPDLPPVPRYIFCAPGDRSIFQPEHVSHAPFLPIVDGLDRTHYMATVFDGKGAWNLPGRDADIDIVQVDTWHRLRKYSLRYEDIDATRVLPSRCHAIEGFDLKRNLPPFPSPPEPELELTDSSTDGLSRGRRSISRGISRGSLTPTTRSPSAEAREKRKWGESLELEVEEYQDDQQEMADLHCAASTCTSMLCSIHNTARGGNHIHSNLSAIDNSHIPIPKPATLLPPLSIPCSSGCYSLSSLQELEHAAEKNHEELSWSTYEEQQLRDILLAYDSSVEPVDPGVCALGRVLERPCVVVALKTISMWSRNPPAVPSLQHRKLSKLGKHKKIRSSPQVMKRYDYHKYPAFVPCDHDGPCGADKCSHGNWLCAEGCKCSLECSRRVKGCRCCSGFSSVPGPVCTIANRCPCAMEWRECNPRLCGPCGSGHEIHNETSTPEYRGEISVKSGSWREDDETAAMPVTMCGNVPLQKAVWPKLRVGISEVAGYGLFADEDIEEDVMLGDYNGDLISDEVAHIRDQVDNAVGRHYMFKTSKNWLIDASGYGNLLRFINNEQDPRINCKASTRRVKRHEELLFYYG
ncbi:hypothetical protein IAT38_002377 [Cryptococcus sp. DSM 104549]